MSTHPRVRAWPRIALRRRRRMSGAFSLTASIAPRRIRPDKKLGRKAPLGIIPNCAIPPAPKYGGYLPPISHWRPEEMGIVSPGRVLLCGRVALVSARYGTSPTASRVGKLRGYTYRYDPPIPAQLAGHIHIAHCNQLASGEAPGHHPAYPSDIQGLLYSGYVSPLYAMAVESHFSNRPAKQTGVKGAPNDLDIAGVFR